MAASLLPAGGRSRRRSAPSTARISRPIARPVSGRWSEAQFRRALARRRPPRRRQLLPGVSVSELYQDRRPRMRGRSRPISSPCRPVRQRNRPPDVAFPFSWRFLLTGWKLLFFNRGPFPAEPGLRCCLEPRRLPRHRARALRRMPHAAELFSVLPNRSRFLAGTAHGPDGKPVPNITPDRDTGIGNWSEDDIVGVLTDGHTPDFDFVGGAMAEVVRAPLNSAPKIAMRSRSISNRWPRSARGQSSRRKKAERHGVRHWTLNRDLL